MFKQRHWVGLVLVTVLASMVVVGCSRAKEPGRFYSDKGFSVVFPVDWRVQSPGIMGTEVMAIAPDDGPEDQFHENANMATESLPGAMSLEDYYTLNVENMAKLMTDFQKLEEGETVANGVRLKWMIYTFRMGQINIKSLGYFAVNKKRGYALAGAASPDTFERFRPQFDGIAGSWRFE